MISGSPRLRPMLSWMTAARLRYRRRRRDLACFPLGADSLLVDSTTASDFVERVNFKCGMYFDIV
jgi:hypothetical protein